MDASAHSQYRYADTNVDLHTCVQVYRSICTLYVSGMRQAFPLLPARGTETDREKERDRERERERERQRERERGPGLSEEIHNVK